MFRDIFSNRLFIGVLVFFVLCVGGSLFYYYHQTQKGAEYDAETQDRIAEWNARQKEQPTAEVSPIAEQPAEVVSIHENGTWHEGEHDLPAPPTPELKTVDTILTSAELDALYHQITAEISEMNSAAELDKGLDLSKYSQKQLEHLRKVGINLSRLPKNLQDKITDHQWRQKGPEPPPQGYTYLQGENGTYFLYKEGEVMFIDTQEQGNTDGRAFFFMDEMEGRTETEIMKALTKGLEGEK